METYGDKLRPDSTAVQMGKTEGPRQPAAGLTSSVQEFCRTSTAHGLGHLPDGSGRARFAWLLIVLVLIVALCYNVGTSLYREAVIQPVRSESVWVMTEKALPFPRTTLCDLSLFRQSRLDARNVSDELASYLASSIGGKAFTTKTFLLDADRQARLQSEYEALLRPGENFTEMVESLSPDCDDVIKGCKLADMQLLGTECCRRFISTVYTIRGKCLQMADFVQEGEGKQNGLLVMLSLPPSEFPNLDRSIVDGCINTRLGLEVMLDDPGRLPHERVFTHSVTASQPGSVELRVTRETTDQEGLMNSVFPTHHGCVAANASRPVESADNCPVLHLAAKVRAVCGCHWLSMPQDPDADPPPLTCSPHQVFSCVVPLQKRMSPPSCLPACHEQDYHPDVISTSLSPMINMLGKSMDIPPEGLLSMQIFFKSLQYRLVRQSLQSSSELLAELGGNMGLFLGVSVVTVFEALVALCGCLGGTCCRHRGRRLGDDGGGGGQGGPLQKEAWPMKEHKICITFNQTSPTGKFVHPPATYHPPAGELLDHYSYR